MRAFFLKPAVIVCSCVLAVLFVWGTVHVSMPSSKVTFTKLGTAVGTNPVVPAAPTAEQGSENVETNSKAPAPGKE